LQQFSRIVPTPTSWLSRPGPLPGRALAARCALAAAPNGNFQSFDINQFLPDVNLALCRDEDEALSRDREILGRRLSATGGKPRCPNARPVQQ
jgi:hypothetical protein